jgi:GT2 family glycosyltransferase
MRFSILIPAPRVTSWLREALPHYDRLAERDFEIIFLPDEPCDPPAPGVIVIPSGVCGPALKRDLGAKAAKGEILAFIDDDAYPDPQWLTAAWETFQRTGVAAVGGPAKTPDSDTFWQRASGASFLSAIGGGAPERYWPVGAERPVDDWPTVNFLVRRQVFLDLGGFDTRYWPGEDTLFCLKLMEAGHQILYVPGAEVWHHRRVGLRAHLKQVGNYGYHRGHFVKKHPDNSLRLKYFVPSGIFLMFAAAPLAAWRPWAGCLWLIGMGAYGLLVLAGVAQIGWRCRQWAVALASSLFIVLSHLIYGLRFLLGLMAPDIDRHRK